MESEHSRRKAFVLMVCFFLLIPSAVAAGPYKGPLVSPDMLKEASLEAHWQSSLPVKQAEEAERMFVFDDYLYVITDSNYLFCMDRHTGSIRFELRLAAAGLSVYGPSYYDERLYFAVGSRILALEPASGAVTAKEPQLSAGSTIVALGRNSRQMFILGSDMRLKALEADSFLYSFTASADNDSLINSLVADDDFVIFSTRAGNVVRMSSEQPQKKWQFDISGEIIAPIVRDGDWVYVGGGDTKLYKLDINGGTRAWAAEFYAGGAITESPVAGADVIYLYAGDMGLYAVDKAGGKAVWHLEYGRSVLCEDGTTAYIFAEPGLLVAMDNVTGRQIFSVNFQQVSRYAVNMTDATIYVSDTAGRVASIGLKGN